MCECLCGNIKEHVHLQVGVTSVVVDAYMGCRECADVIGVDVRCFNAKGRKEWLSTKPTEITPDEYGVIPSAASFQTFAVKDFAAAAEEKGLTVPEEYETWDDWAHDNLLSVLQAAFRKCQVRVAKRTSSKEVE